MKFLKIDLELISTHPELSAGAIMLYSFIEFRANIAAEDSDGRKYINYQGDNDPRRVLSITSKQLRSRTEELKKAGLIYSRGHGAEYKLYIGADPDKEMTFDHGLPNAQKGSCSPNAQKGSCQAPKREQPNAQKGASPKINNIQVFKNKRMCVEKNIINKHTQANNNLFVSTPAIIPTIDEIREEAKKAGYKTDVQAFFNYNRMRGWQGIKDWKVALLLWASHDSQHGASCRGKNGSITGQAAGITYEITEEPPIINIDPDNITERILEVFGG